MLSRAQIILLQRAKHQAALDDVEYRDAIETVSASPGCRSSKDKRLSDRHLDNLMSYFEAIYWRKVDGLNQSVIQRCAGIHDVFRAGNRNFWSSRNSKGNTSRDRFAADAAQSEVDALETELTRLGCCLPYLRSIQNRMRSGGKEFNLVKYAGALKRTLSAKQRKIEQPF